MNIELVQAKSKLAEYKKKHRDLDLRISAFIPAVRECLPAWFDNISELDTEKAVKHVNNIHSAVEEMKDLETKIKKLEKDLGV